MFDPERQLLVFTHIPKCGGTSVHQCLGQMMPGKYAVISANNPVSRISDEVHGVGGHFSFNGIPESVLRGREPVYMTILRHPVERVISFFKHVAARRDHYAHVGVDNFQRKRPYEILCQWHELGFLEIENLTTQMLCNRKPEAASANLALRNLTEYYRFVATVDHIDQLLGALAAFLGVSTPTLDKLNTAKVRSIENLRSADFLQKVLELNEKDLLLYREVVERLEGGKKLWSSSCK